jgi:RHS repeat-associated protein
MLVTGTPKLPISTITHSGTTATITLTSGLSGVTNGTTIPVTIAGATDPLYNGNFTATVTSATTLTYTMSGTPLLAASGVDLVMSSQTMTVDNAISRIGGIEDHGGTNAGTVVEGYSYLGLDTIVVRNRPQEKTQLSYVQQTGDGNAITDGGDRYTGLDRFGRILDQNWINYGAGTTTDRFQYGYDRDSNVLYEKNLVNGAFSELFHTNSTTSGDNVTAYDKLNREIGFRRGTLSAVHNGTVPDTVTTSSETQSWTLDAVGNATGFNDSSTTNQTAVLNSRNQYTSLTGGTATATPTFDNNGNMITDQAGKHYHYDAWNQLVSVYDTNGTTRLLTVADDATERMIKYDNGSAGDLYYSGTQLIESRYAAVYNQYVWGMGYVNDVLVRDRNGDSNTGTGSLGEGNSGLEERVYAQQDANWDVTSIYNIGTSSIPERFAYNPYGGYSNLNGSWATFNDTSWFWSFKFQGARYEGTGGFYFMGLRLESTALGRWMQQDPSGYGVTANLYAADSDNPTRMVDPFGLSPCSGQTDSRIEQRIQDLQDLRAEIEAAIVTDLNGSPQGSGFPGYNAFPMLPPLKMLQVDLQTARGIDDEIAALKDCAFVHCGNKLYRRSKAQGMCCVNGRLVPKAATPTKYGGIAGDATVWPPGIVGAQGQVSLTANSRGQLTVSLTGTLLGGLGGYGGIGTSLVGGAQTGVNPTVGAGISKTVAAGGGAGPVTAGASISGPVSGAPSSGTGATLSFPPMPGFGLGAYAGAGGSGSCSLSTPPLVSCW